MRGLNVPIAVFEREGGFPVVKPDQQDAFVKRHVGPSANDKSAAHNGTTEQLCTACRSELIEHFQEGSKLRVVARKPRDLLPRVA